MSHYKIRLPDYNTPLFGDFSYDLLGSSNSRAKISIKTDLLSDTPYYTTIVKTSNDNIYLLIKSPRDDTCKTVIVKRELDKNNSLSLNISYYGSLCTNDINALGACAKRFGCDRILLGTESLSEFLDSQA